MSENTPKSKPTIKELETILNQEGDQPIEILPNGEIRTKSVTPKPLTINKELGGEYIAAAEAIKRFHRAITVGQMLEESRERKPD